MKILRNLVKGTLSGSDTGPLSFAQSEYMGTSPGMKRTEFEPFIDGLSLFLSLEMIDGPLSTKAY